MKCIDNQDLESGSVESALSLIPTTALHYFQQRQGKQPFMLWTVGERLTKKS